MKIRRTFYEQPVALAGIFVYPCKNTPVYGLREPSIANLRFDGSLYRIKMRKSAFLYDICAEARQTARSLSRTTFQNS
jgi:hypothetical protein